MRRLTFCLLLLLAASPQAQTCLDYSALPQPIALMASNGAIQRIAEDGDRFAFAAAGAQEGDVRVVLGSAEAGEPLTVLGEIVLPRGRAWCLDLDGPLVALGFEVNYFHQGWLLIDFSDPAAPVVRSETTTDQRMQAIALEGEVLITAQIGVGFLVYDVSNPASPVHLLDLPDAASGWEVKADGGRWYACGGYGEETFLRVYELIDPLTPVLLGELTGWWGPDGNSFLSLDARDGRLAVRHVSYYYDEWDGSSESYYSLRFYDATVPSAIAPAGVFNFKKEDCGTPALDDGYAYCSVDGSLRMYAEVDGTWQDVHGLALDVDRCATVVCDGRVLYTDTPGLFELEPLTHADGAVLSTLPIGSSYAQDLEVTDTHLFFSRVQVSAGGMGDYDQGSVRIHSLADPALPVDVGTSWGFMGFPLGDIVVHGDYLYSGLSTIAWPGGATEPDGFLIRDGVARGDALYTTRSSGLAVYDLGDPAAPSLVDEIPAAGNPVAVAERPGWVFAAGASLVVFDATDPLAPVVARSLPLTPYASRAHLDGDRLYLVGSQGMTLWDVADPLDPVQLGVLYLPDLKDVAAAGDLVYLAAGPWGLLLVDVSDPADMDVYGGYHGGSGALRVDAAHGLVYLLDEHELHVLRPDCLGVVAIDDPWTPELPPAAPRTALAPPVPNPFNPATELTFTLARPGTVSLTIHDAAGRRVRTLVDEARAEGPHTVQWDGRDAAGRAASAGVYFARFTVEGVTETRKLALVK